MPGINSFKRGRMRSVLKLVIFIFSFLALLSACGDSNSTPPVSTPKWTWVSGSNIVNQAGVYGTKGTAASSNVPGARYLAVSWVDSQGKLWLFGGWGYDSAGYESSLNDLWKYDPTTLDWTWVSGSNTGNQAGVYGTKGTAAPSNVPGGRSGLVSWLDSQGKTWLFGGWGIDSAGNYSSLNDLWKFDPTTHEWTWVSGSNTVDQAGIYGTQGTAAPSNVPGGRIFGAVSWIDSENKLWLFGGFGFDSAGNTGSLNDLWKFDPTTHEWTWVSGSSSVYQVGIYGTQGTAAPSNVPGGRCAAVSWLDSNGKLWLFGGNGAHSAGNSVNLNDLWKYDPTTNEWTWVSGSSSADQAGVYGTKDIADSSNVPGGRNAAISWLDSNGKLWLFGGVGLDLAGHGGDLNDLWKYDPTTNEWTWVSGSSSVDQGGIYGTRGTADSSNVPGGRQYAVPWFDSSGKLWLFGGFGLFLAGNGASLNDLWHYIR